MQGAYQCGGRHNRPPQADLRKEARTRPARPAAPRSPRVILTAFPRAAPPAPQSFSCDHRRQPAHVSVADFSPGRPCSVHAPRAESSATAALPPSSGSRGPRQNSHVAQVLPCLARNLAILVLSAQAASLRRPHRAATTAAPAAPVQETQIDCECAARPRSCQAPPAPARRQSPAPHPALPPVPGRDGGPPARCPAADGSGGIRTRTGPRAPGDFKSPASAGSATDPSIVPQRLTRSHASRGDGLGTFWVARPFIQPSPRSATWPCGGPPTRPRCNAFRPPTPRSTRRGPSLCTCPRPPAERSC